MDLKEIKVTSLKQGMRLVNIGTVDHIDEYSNAVFVFLSIKKIKEEESFITFSPFERVLIHTGIDD